MTRLAPPTFLECEELAIFASERADRERALARAAGHNPPVARQYLREAERLDRIVQILGWVGQREDRLHILTEPARREPRFGGAS